MERKHKLRVVAVEDWTGRELVRFTQSDCLDRALEWVNTEVSKGRTEEEEDGIREDLYIIGYNWKGKEIAVDFG